MRLPGEIPGKALNNHQKLCNGNFRFFIQSRNASIIPGEYPKEFLVASLKNFKEESIRKGSEESLKKTET